MASAPLPLLVIVISGPCPRSRTGANQCALAATNYSSSTRANSRSDADALGRFAFAGLRIPSSSLSRGNVNRQG